MGSIERDEEVIVERLGRYVEEGLVRCVYRAVIAGGCTSKPWLNSTKKRLQYVRRVLIDSFGYDVNDIPFDAGYKKRRVD